MSLILYTMRLQPALFLYITLSEAGAHCERMQERPSARKVLAYEKQVIEEFSRTA